MRIALRLEIYKHFWNMMSRRKTSWKRKSNNIRIKIKITNKKMMIKMIMMMAMMMVTMMMMRIKSKQFN